MNIPKRKIMPALFVLAALAGAMLLGACSKKNADAAATEAQKELVKFPVPFLPTAYTQILSSVAKEEGFYSGEGLDVVFETFTGASNLEKITVVLTGKVRVSNGAGSTAPLTYLEENESTPLLMIGGSMANYGFLIIPKGKESEWEGFTPEKIEGKKIGVVRANSQDTAFRAFLARQGVDLSKVDFVELGTGASMIEGVVKGEIDGCVLTGIHRTVAAQRGLIVYKYVDDLFGNFVCCRIIVSADEARANRDQYVGYLAANIKAYKVYKTNPDRVIEIARKYLPDVDEAVLRREFFADDHLGVHPDPESDLIKDFYQALIDIGYCKGPVERVEPYIDISFYKEALDRVISQYPKDPFYQELVTYFQQVNDGIIGNETL